MNCPKCASLLPDDSCFCQYCGFRLSHEVKGNLYNQNENEREKAIETSAENAANPTSAGKIAVTETNHSESLSKRSASKKVKRTGWLWAVIIVAALFIISLATNVYQVYKSNAQTTSLEGKISALEKENLNFLTEKSKLESVNERNEELITSQRKQITSLQNEKYDGSEIYGALNRFSYGSAFSDYYTNSEIIVVRVGETKTLKVTYTVTVKSTLAFQADNSNSFGEWVNDWDSNGCCSLKITGSLPGTTIYSFTNDYNNHAFKVLVIVLPKE